MPLACLCLTGARSCYAQAFNLTDVRLIADADNHFQQAQELNTEFLKYLEADRLLYTFRTIAQLPQKPGCVTSHVIFRSFVVHSGLRFRCDLSSILWAEISVGNGTGRRRTGAGSRRSVTTSW